MQVMMRGISSAAPWPAELEALRLDAHGCWWAEVSAGAEALPVWIATEEDIGRVFHGGAQGLLHALMLNETPEGQAMAALARLMAETVPRAVAA